MRLPPILIHQKLLFFFCSFTPHTSSTLLRRRPLNRLLFFSATFVSLFSGCPQNGNSWNKIGARPERSWQGNRVPNSPRPRSEYLAKAREGTKCSRWEQNTRTARKTSQTRELLAGELLTNHVYYRATNQVPLTNYTLLLGHKSDTSHEFVNNWVSLIRYFSLIS